MIETLTSRHNLSIGTSEQKVFDKQVQSLTGKNKNTRYSMYLDLDEDGLVDFYDNDIDGDGIHNLSDSHPMDSMQGLNDIDSDFIPDFVDFDEFDFLNQHSSFQSRIFNDYGVTLIITSDQYWNNEDIIEFQVSVNYSDQILKKLKTLEVITLSDTLKNSFGEYRNYLNTIFLYPSYDKRDVKSTRITYLHELFHVYAEENTEIYKDFKKISPWSPEENFKYSFTTNAGEKLTKSLDDLLFAPLKVDLKFETSIPSKYSLISPKEHFAEAAALSYITLHDLESEFDMTRFINQDNYQRSAMNDFFIKNI